MWLKHVSPTQRRHDFARVPVRGRPLRLNEDVMALHHQKVNNLDVKVFS